MSLLWIEGFEGYGTTVNSTINTYLQERYASIAQNNATGPLELAAGRVAGFCLWNNDTLNSWGSSLLTPVIGSGNTTLVVGLGYKPLHLLGSAYRLLVQFWNGSSLGIDLREAANGYVAIGRNNGAALATSTSAVLAAGTWCYLEISVTFGNPGTVTVRANGSVVLTYSGNTLAGSASLLQPSCLWAESELCLVHELLRRPLHP